MKIDSVCTRRVASLAFLFLFILQARSSVTVTQNLGAEWVGNPTVEVADQPSVNLNSTESNWGSSAPYSLGQTFTTPVSGTLSNIELYVTGKNTTNILYLYDLGPAIQFLQSQPSVIISGSNAVSANLLSTNLMVAVPSTGSASVMQLTFSGADAVQLIGGHEYYFAMVSLSASSMWWDRDGGSTDVYAGGAAYRQNSFINGSKTTDFSLAVVLANTNSAPTIYDCVVDWNNVHQRIDGFGASSAWRSTWTAGEADMFFSTNSGTGTSLDGKTNFPFNGISLSLLRNHINTNATTTSEISIMQMAQARGARVWSTPWSPPQQFKSNNNPDGGNYLSASNQAYANLLANYVVNMKKIYGVNIYALSVQNEPDVSASYESCLWTAQQIHDFVPYLSSALQASNVAATQIILPEDEHWETNYYYIAMQDAAVATNVGIVACHNYDGSPPNNVPTQLPGYANTNAALWETEVSKLSGNGAFDPSMTDAMYWATRIHMFMTGAQANAWHYWWLISGNPDNEGLTDTNGIPAQRMYVLGQYSRFVRPNNYRIDLANYNPYAILASAYKDPVANNFAIVTANTNATATTQSFYLTNFTATSVTPWITSSNQSLAVQSPVTVTNGAFAYVIPGMSVVTFAGTALLGGAGGPTLLPVANLTVNPGFNLQVTNTAVDANVPPLSLTFTLLTGPTNATLTSINAMNALFSWTPLASQANSSNLITVVVTDSGTPGQSATNSFYVTVNPVVGIVPTTTTISSSAGSVAYGTPVTFTAIVTPAPTNGETVVFMAGSSTLGTGTLNGGMATYTTSSTTLTPPGSPYSVSAVYNGDGYYQSSSSPFLSQGVTAASVTVTSGLTANNKTYDGTTSATINSNTVQLAGVILSDAGNVALFTNGYTASFASQNVGNGLPVTVGGLTLSGSAAGNYSLAQPALSGNILPITIALATGSGSLKITNNFTSGNNQFEVYNGLNGFSPALNGALYTNFQCDVRFAPDSATQTNSAGVLVFGHLQFGTRTNFNQDYFGGANYGIDIPATNTGWVHISIPLSVAADPNLASINDVLIHIYGPSYATTLVGPSTLWVDNIAFVGPANSYVVDQFNPAGTGGNSYAGGQIGTVWANWFGASWVANSWDATNDAVGVSANNKNFDGTTNATITPYDNLLNAALSGILSGDLTNVSLATNGYTAAFAGAAPGTNIPVTVSGLSLGGSAGGNYVVPPLNLSANIAQVNRQAPIVSIAPTVSAITYGQTLASSTLSGGAATNMAGAAVTGNFAFVVPSMAPNAGSPGVPVMFTPMDTTDYNAVTNNVPVTVNAAAITVTANNQTKTVGLPNPALTATYGGLVNGDSTNVLTALAALTTPANAASPTGRYTITPNGASAANYTFSYVSGTLTVSAQPQITPTAINADAGNLVFTFPTVTGQNYQLEYSTNLATWTPVGAPIPGNGSSISLTNIMGSGPGFWSLQISQL